MTIVNQAPVDRSTANGVTTIFPFSFLLIDVDDLDVYLGNDLADQSLYTTTGLDNDSGGQIQFFTPPANGTIVVRKRNVALQRLVDYQNAGDFRTGTVNRDFDRLWMAVQDVNYQAQRALHVGPSDDSDFDALQVPGKLDRASYFWVWDADGNASISSGTGADAGLRADLANTSNPALGAAKVGVNGVTVRDIVTKSSVVVDSVAAMQALPIAAYTNVFTRAYSAIGDGGSGQYRYDGSSSATVNSVTVFAALGGVGRWLLVHNGGVSVRQAGARGDASSDDTAALRLAFSAWASAYSTTGKFKLFVPDGQYKITATIDLRNYFTSTSGYFSLDFEMSGGATFYQSAALSPMIDFSCANGGTFAYCKFIFGNIGGTLLGGIGIRFRNTVNSHISFISANAFDDGAGNGQAIEFNTGALAGNYNNLITINAMNSNNVGLLALDTGAPPHGFQGNIVTIGHCASNKTGIWFLNQSTSNTVNIASLEGSVNKGILDQSGYNIFRLNFVAADVVEFGTANGRIDLEGYGFTFNDSGNSTGFVKDNAASDTPVIPAMPASNVAYRNVFERPASVSISGGTVASITIDGVLTGVTSGSFRMSYGKNISIIYSVAPSWIWTFE